jgi:uncharacterized protein
MLLRFEVANHRSIFEPVELSMIAVDGDRLATRGFDLLNERVLTVAGIYGPNASGKSNVLASLAWLTAAVQRSLRAWGEVIPRDPFRFGTGAQVPSTYEVEMMAENVRYSYHLEVSSTQVLSENLVSYPKRQPRTLFERQEMKIDFRRGLRNAAGARDLLTPTTLALAALMRFNEPDVMPLGLHLRNIICVGVPRKYGYELNAPATDTIFEEGSTAPQEVQESAASMLRLADLGIDGVRMVPVPDDPSFETITLLHRASGQEISFTLLEESAGTRVWFEIIGPALHALRFGHILLFDEIDASLHPRLTARLLELFQDPATNANNAQLIFTSHDTSLLNYLNRDEVWLTEKDEKGMTALTALAEFGGEKVRRSLNLEKAYLQGRFGAVPEIDQLALRQALGLLRRDDA